MASSGSLSLVVRSSTRIDIHYSVYIEKSSHTAIITVNRVDRVGGRINWIDLGTGSHSGVYAQGGLLPNTAYRFDLYDYKDEDVVPLLFLYDRLDRKDATTQSSSPPPPPEPSGTLSAGNVEVDTVDINYSYQDGTDVTLFRDTTLLQTFGSGSGSGIYEDSELDPEAEYTYYLRNGTTTGSTKLAEVTINTPEYPAGGSLSGEAIDSQTIDLTYQFNNGTDVSLFRDGTRIKTFGSGNGSGVYRDTKLDSYTSYAYTLRDGTSSDDYLLASSTVRTLKEAKRTTIERGKVLPLSSLVHIYDSTLTKVGILEDYEYLYWNYKFRKPGNFQLVINRYKSNTEYLIKGNVLALYISGYYRAGVIESKEITLDEKGKISENYTITGRELGGLLSERVAINDTTGIEGTGYDSQNTYAETAMRYYVNKNCIDADDTDRNYPLLYVDTDQERGGNIKYDARFQTIAELLEEISLASNLGWEILLDSDNRMVFRIIEGVDRSFGNGVNSVVMFSPEFGNIRLISFSDSNIGSKNIAYVAGQGEADDRTIQEVTKDAGTYTGMDRREFLIDARDLDETAKLTQRGNERLAELGEEKIVEMENLSTGPFSYGEDFYLGDIVTVIYPDIVEADLRLIESTIEITPQKIIKNKLIFGKSYPDLINIREFKDKNYLTETRR